MTTNLTITKAGDDAIARALLDSANAITITTVAAGIGVEIIPDLVSVTALQKEIARTAFIGDSASMPAAVAGYGLFEGSDEWAAWEIGIFARSGANGGEFLFAYAQAANNSSGVKTALLVKSADEPVRYDFSLVFAPAALAPRVPAPTPVSTPMPCAVPLSLSCPIPTATTRFATDAEAKARATVDAALKPNQQQQWRSVNNRAPTPTDAAFPVGHLWMYGKNEWVLESHAANATAQWRQVKGTKLIYTAINPPASVRQNVNVNTSADITDFSQLFFHTVIGSISSLSSLDMNGPISITTEAFVNGEGAYVNRDEYKTAFANYVDSRTITLYNEYSNHYINKIYGVY